MYWDLQILHTCDVPACCNPSHLWLGTPLDNHQDKEEKNRGNHAIGENNGSSKLTDPDILLIRELYSQGISQDRLAIRFHVCQSVIGAIVRYETWKHVR